jgi:hypothetical protein
MYLLTKKSLRDTKALLKLHDKKPFEVIIRYVEEDGFWLVSQDLYAALTQGVVWNGLKEPVIFVPTTQVEWLIASSEEASSRH